MKTRPPGSARNSRRIVPAARPAPRLSHEADESGTQPAAPRTGVMKTAHHDVESGLVDTDQRGVKATRAFKRAFGDSETSDTVVVRAGKKRVRTRP